MATTVPTNLENPGTQPKSLRTDNFGYIQYPKLRNTGAEAYDTRAYSAANNITLQPSDFIRLIVFISTSTFAQATLPATATLAAYLQRIYSVENQTGTTGGNPTPQDGKVYYFPLVIDNQRNTGVGTTDLVTLVAGDGSTTFALGTNQVGRGLNKMLLRFATAGSPAVATLTVVPDFRTGGTSSTPFAAVPIYTPFPLQDADNLGLWDASNANQWSSLTRQQFFSGGVTATNVLIGPGTNYAATGGGNVVTGSGSGTVLSTGTSNTITGSLSGTALTTGARNTIYGPSNFTTAGTAAMTDVTIVGNINNPNDATQNGLIILGYNNQPQGNFINCTCIGNGIAGATTVFPAANTTLINRIRNVASANTVSYNPTTLELTQAASNKYIKKNIEPMPDVSDKILDLKPIKYINRGARIKKGTDSEIEYFDEIGERQYYGLLAHEVDEVAPEIIFHGEYKLFSEKLNKEVAVEGPDFAINYDDRSLVAMLIQFIQKLHKRVKELEARE